jgi:hypothetical protein
MKSLEIRQLTVYKYYVRTGTTQCVCAACGKDIDGGMEWFGCRYCQMCVHAVPCTDDMSVSVCIDCSRSEN